MSSSTGESGLLEELKAEGNAPWSDPARTWAWEAGFEAGVRAVLERLSSPITRPEDQICPHGLHFNGHYCDECPGV